MAPPPARGLRCVWRGGGEDTGNWHAGDMVSSGQGRGARIMGVNGRCFMFIQNTTLPNIMFIYVLDGGKLDDFEFEQHPVYV